MDEFLKLILTGERLKRLKRLNLFFGFAAVAESVCAMVLLFTAAPTVHAAVPIVSGVLVIIFGIINTVLLYNRANLCATLVNEQIFADGMNIDDVSIARKSFAEKYGGLYTGKYAKVTALLNLIPTGIYIAAAIISFLISIGKNLSLFAVPVLYVLATVATFAIALVPAFKEAKNKTALYESADGEITLLKRSAGIAEGEIAKQSYNAKNTATRSQELFLCDPADRAELKRIYSSVGYWGVALAAAFIAATVALGLMSDKFDNLFMTVCSSCFVGSLFAAFVAVAVWTEIRRRAVFRRNAFKFTDSEADNMRKFLQSEFLKLQKVGNLFFSLLCGIATLTGFILGVIGAVKDPEVSFTENVLGLSVVFFLMSVILATVIWTVLYCLYRRKVKPVEIQLNDLLQKL